MNHSSPSDASPSNPVPAAPADCRVLVVGNRGMLGQDLMTRLELGGFAASGLDLPDIDITNPEQVESSLRAHLPTLVINCAAYTAVDKAESEQGIAFAVNRDGAAFLADGCRKIGVPLIHLSTDYVFDGYSKEPYGEEDPANPLGVYGQSKWEGEDAIRRRLPQHLIVRTAWLFGAHGPNFVKTILRLAAQREELRVVADQHGCPTWTVHLADALVAMVRHVLRDRNPIEWGTYHFCGKERTTWHGFAEEIIREGVLRQLVRAVRVIPITTEEYPTPAPRPAWSVLDCRKIGVAFGVKPGSWRIGLVRILDEILTSQ